MILSHLRGEGTDHPQRSPREDPSAADPTPSAMANITSTVRLTGIFGGSPSIVAHKKAALVLRTMKGGGRRRSWGSVSGTEASYLFVDSLSGVSSPTSMDEI